MRRLYFLKFAELPAQKNLELKKAIALEGAGILNRLLPDLLNLAGISCGGENSESARERFTLANDPVGAFVQAECLLAPGVQERKDRMEKKFEAFLIHHGLTHA